jgi:hypothetical protein
MLLLMLTAREGPLSSRRRRFTHTDHVPALRLKSPRGVAFVCLGVVVGAPHDVKTGGNAALLNRR